MHPYKPNERCPYAGLIAFCGVEVKREFEGAEAEAQLATWMSAGFSSMRSLEVVAGKVPGTLKPLLG